MAKTARDAWKHIREWSEFFDSVRSVTNEEVEAFLMGRKKKKYLQQSLERLEKKGLLSRSKNRYHLTSKGKIAFRKYKVRWRVEALKFQEKRQWDGKWRLVSFDIPTGFNRERESLRRLLKYLNFYQLHKSVWVYPDQITEEFWNILVEYELDKFCKVMLVEFIEGDKEIREHFSVKDKKKN